MTDLLQPSNEPPKLHALVVSIGGKALLICGSYFILEDMSEIGAERDLDDGGPPAPEKDGLWVWEGAMIWSRGGTSYYGEPGDDDVEYKGEYRRATLEEAAKLLNGEMLWPEDAPDPDDDHDRQDL